MSEYTPPFPPSELVFHGAESTDLRRPGREYNDRHFIILDTESGFWLKDEDGNPDGFDEDRDNAAIWTGAQCAQWNIGSTGELQLLPVIENEEMTEAEALAFSYKAPYPAAEMEFNGPQFEDLRDDRAYLIREKDTGTYWRSSGEDNAEKRDSAFVFTKQYIGEHTYASIMPNVIVELLPLPGYEQAAPPAAPAEPVKEVELTPGQVLYGLLKNNPSTVQTGGNFENKASILKYMKQTTQNNCNYWNAVIDRGTLPDAMTIHTLNMMLNGDSQTITSREYEELTKLASACWVRLNALCNKPVANDAQRKLSSAITKTNGF